MGGNAHLPLYLPRRGRSTLVPKGRKDSARGFSPWLAVQYAPALKGRQKCVTDRCAFRWSAETISSALSGRVAFLIATRG